MRLVLLNFGALMVVALPLIGLEALGDRVAWIKKHHGSISVVLWISLLAFVYLVILPTFGLVKNPSFFRWEQ